MVSARALLLSLLALAACKSTHSQSYLLRVTPTALTVAMADSLTILFQRSDTSDQQSFTEALPATKPAAPWQLDVRTGGWGNAPFVVTVTATQNGNFISSGQGLPVNGVIDVQLYDGAPGNPDLAVGDDLSGGPVDLSCQTMTVTANPFAHGQLSQALPGANYVNAGSFILTKSVGVTPSDTVGIFAFDVTALPTSANIQSMTLSFSYPSNSNECGNGCGSCSSTDTGGSLDVYFMQTLWSPATCNWQYAKQGMFPVQWNMPGASGSGTDRSASRVGTVTRGAQQNTVISIDPSTFNQIAAWRTANKLDFELVPTNGTFVLATARWSLEGCTSSNSVSPPTLQIIYCN